MITPSFGLTATERVLPQLALDFTTATLDPRITFTRSGNTATAVNSNGDIVLINADLPRFDYNPLTFICRGLLIEDSRTNTLQYSEDFSNAFWIKNGMLAFGSGSTVDAIVSPDGSQNADLLTENTATGSHQLGVNLSFNYVSGTNYCQSYFVKSNGRNNGRIQFRSDWFGTNGANFNLSNKTISLVTGSSASSRCGIDEYKNGWFRVWLAATATATGTSPTDLNFTFADSAGAISYTGDGTSGIYLWGAQLEIGLSPSSYIPNLSNSTTTRNSDIATMTGTNFSSWYSSGAGGVVARVLPSTVSGTRPILQFDDATADEIIALQGNTTNPELVIVDSGSPQAQIDAGTIAANTAYNLGAAWDTDNCAAAVNGGAAVTDTSATIPTVTQARLGSDGTNYLNGHLQIVRYWPQRIINAEVQAFSK